MTARIIMKVGSNVQEIPIGSEPVSIGRAEECTITITDLKSSRKHCSIVPQGEGYAVQDHDSSNGTQLNGQKIAKQGLVEGDVITIGKTTFIYHGPSATGEAEGGDDPKPVKEKWVLIMEVPDGTSTSFDLEAKVSIGRNAKNMISIQDPKASNFHCEIIRDGPGYKVRDLNSTNGTRVDGKLVDDLDLYHGSVISIGKTHFTIKNLAIPDAETGFDSGPVGGPEFASFRRKRRSFPWAILLGLAVVAGGLWAFNILLQTQVKTEGIANPAGNLLGENYSFEGMTDSRGFPVGYRSLQGEGDDVSVQKGPARSGKKALLVNKGPAGDPAAEMEVIYGEEIPVAPGKVYELSAWAMPSGLQGVCGVKVVWLSRKNPYFRAESLSSLLWGDGDDYVQVRVKAMVPLGASMAETVFFVKGREGSVYVDDMEFREASGDDDFVLEGDRLDLRVGKRGLFSIRRSGGLRDIVRDGQILLFVGKAGEESRAWQRYCRVDEGFPKSSEGKVEIQGSIHDFTSGAWIPFRETLSLTEGQIAIAFEVDDPAGALALAGISLSPERDEIEDGVGIVTRSSFEVMKGGFEAGNVVRMLWGQSTRPVSFNYEPPVYVRQVRENDQVLILQLVGRSAEGSVTRLTCNVQTNFKQVDAEIRDALSVARESERRGKPGEAMARLKEVLTKYPFMRIPSKSDLAPKSEKTGTEWFERLEKKAFAETEKIRTRFEVAQFFRNLREMEASLGDATLFVDTFAGSPEGKDMKDLAERVRLAIQDQRTRQGQGEADGFLLRAREHRDLDEKPLAVLLYEHVTRIWPGTEWAQTADRELRAMRGENVDDGEKGEKEEKGEKKR